MLCIALHPKKPGDVRAVLRARQSYSWAATASKLRVAAWAREASLSPFRRRGLLRRPRISAARSAGEAPVGSVTDASWGSHAAERRALTIGGRPAARVAATAPENSPLVAARSCTATMVSDR